MTFRKRYTGLIERYRDRLPIHDDARIISLGEGNTPLIRLHNIPDLLGKDVDIYVKYEGLNPTGSFKDRGMTMAVTQAVDQGAKAIICASTGNTSASAAAYAARAGITAFVLIPDGKIAQGKLAQARVEGAVVIQIRGNFDDGMRLVKEVAETAGGAIVGSRPKMVGYQASGSAPFLRGEMVDDPDTVATAIRIGHPQSWDNAWIVNRESDGWFDECSDDEILAAQKLLAEKGCVL